MVNAYTDNKSLALDALDTLFNRRNFDEAAKLWSSAYIQHSRLVPSGREGLFQLVRNRPEGTRYEPGLTLAEGEFVMVHGRYAQPGHRALIAVDIFRVQAGLLTEHWDVLQEEATAAESAGGYPMFGERFADNSQNG